MSAPAGKGWTSARLLRAMLAAQCLLAVMVVVGDLPRDLLGGMTGSGPAVPTTDVPVTPGNQTRQFRPNRLPATAPNGPGFLSDDIVPRRLEFTTAAIDGYDDAILITGTIADGDAKRFDDWLKARPTPP